MAKVDLSQAQAEHAEKAKRFGRLAIEYLQACEKRDSIIWAILRYSDDGSFPQELNKQIDKWKEESLSGYPAKTMSGQVVTDD